VTHFDLHSHTCISDGILAPAELVAAAARVGIDVFAITDHDTVGGIAPALEAAAACGLSLVPGIEISATHGERELHLLAYFAPERLDAWEVFQEERRSARWERFHAILDKLDSLGAPLEREPLLAERGLSVPGRPHLARAMVDAGHARDFQDAFQRYLGSGKPAHVVTRGPTAAEAIAFVAQLPALSVLAHPIYNDLDAVLEELVELGLDGVEAYHHGHSEEQVGHFAARARDLGLITTGGSDYHGDPDDPQGELAGERLGHVALPEAAGAAFVDALAARTGWRIP
jgi:predicted metal-dependent phosphoesterase TrpH